VRGAIYIASRIILSADAVLSPGAIAVAAGTVVAAGSPRDVERAVPHGFRRREFPGAALLPGLVNAHTHLQIPRLPAPEGEAPGASGTFVDWILRVIAWRHGAQPEEFRKNFDAAAIASLACGTTAAGEIAGPDASVYAACPLRARVFAEGIGFAPEVADVVLPFVSAVLVQLKEAGGAGSGRILPGVSPHTLYTVSPALLRGLADLARERGIPACLHLAESPAEMEFLRTGGGEISTRLYPAVGKDVSWFRGIGAPLPDYLAEAGILREGLILVHNVHLSRQEASILRERGARFILCPRSNAAHGNGSPDVTHFVDAAVPFCLGTDSLGSVADLSMWEEMRAARSLYRGGLPDVDLCRALFRAATENGAAALGLPGGALKPGGPADFIITDDAGGNDPGDAIIRLVDRTARENVRLTVVGGDHRYERP
jgi:cytosine/adenosine deaminase-related metal-dependent hydrolase